MKQFINVLKKASVFKYIPDNEILELLECFGWRTKEYTKNEMIISEGDIVSEFGIVLSGRARSLKLDISGKVFTLTLLAPGSMTGVLLAASMERKSSVSVQVLDDACMLFVPFAQITKRCPKGCQGHEQLLLNYFDSVAEWALLLHDRNDCLIKPSVRSKVLEYLSRVSRESGSNTFSVPFDRHGMAEYLNVERSALSRELSRMKKDGILDFHKESFRLL